MKTILVFLFTIPLVISMRINGDDDTSFEPVTPEPKSRFAMLQDVQLLANGLLQLGRGLKDFAMKTKGQMDNIFQKLNIFDRSFSEISQQTNEIKEEEEQLRKTTIRLQANNEEIRNVSLELNSKIQILSQEKIQLQEKVGKLEEKITELFQTLLEIQEPEQIASLKNLVEQQDNHLQNLLKMVQVQHAQLAKQQEQIQDLEEKRSNPAFQDDTQLQFAVKEDETRNTKLNATSKIQYYEGGCWYSACEETNLNGKYIKPSSKGELERKKRGLYWKPQKGRPYLLKSIKLVIHPTDFYNFD